MKRIWLSLIAAGLLAIAAIGPVAAQEDSLTVDLNEVDGSGISGTATLTEENGSTSVEIQLDGTSDDGVHPVHIHSGTCDDLGDVVYPLEDIVDGMSESTVEASIDDILAADHAINAHLSADEMNVYVACGEVASAEDEEDDAAAEDDDAAVEDDDAAVEDDDAAAEEDETDDAVEDDDMTDDEDDAMAEEDEEADDAEDIVPATGSISGISAESGVLMMTLLAGGTLGAGLLIRRRMVHA